MYYLCATKITIICNNIMKRTILFSLSLTAALLLLVGCCNCRQSSRLHKPLVGTTWQLVQIMARDISAEGDSYTLLLHDNGTATAMGDCNRITATYRMTISRELGFSNIGATRRMCKNQEMEAAFVDMLERVTHYEMDADMMLLLSNGTLIGIMKSI